MSRYVLGESGARKLRELMNGRGVSGSVSGSGAGLTFEDEFAAPFAVQWAASVGESGSWIVWLPSDGCLTVDGEQVDLTGEIEVAGGAYPAGWYQLDCLGEDADKLYLNVHIQRSSQDDESEVSASFSSSPDEPEDDETVIPIVVAEIDGKDVKAVVSSAITITGGGVSADVVSVDEHGGDDSSRLQIAHFADSEMDSTKGLCSRLKVDVNTGEVSASGDDSLMLVCRKNGRVVYVPIGGEGVDPESARDVGEDDPCAHDKSKQGGVSPGIDDDHGGASSDDFYLAGGVAADGSPHTGDDNCNCR